MNLAEHQEKAFEALQHLKTLLEKNGIGYYLLAGSALGAVRHKGFIPWDDDVDLGILYQDIPKLEELLMANPIPGFRFVCNRNDPTYPRLYGKILYHGYGCIDLFPLVRISDNRIVRRLQWIIRKITWKVYSRKVGYLHEKEKPVWVFVSRILSLLMSKKMVLKISDLNCRLCMDRDTEYFINMFSIYSMKREMIAAKCVNHPQNVEFSGEMFQTLGYLDEYLTNLYGDYMTPVPPSEQVATHVEVF